MIVIDHLRPAQHVAAWGESSRVKREVSMGPGRHQSTHFPFLLVRSRRLCTILVSVCSLPDLNIILHVFTIHITKVNRIRGGVGGGLEVKNSKRLSCLFMSLVLVPVSGSYIVFVVSQSDIPRGGPQLMRE